VRCDYSCPSELDLDIKTATQFYRITQEAVANAIQHGILKSNSRPTRTKPCCP